MIIVILMFIIIVTVIMVMMITILILIMPAGIPGVFEVYGTTPNYVSKLTTD